MRFEAPTAMFLNFRASYLPRLSWLKRDPLHDEEFGPALVLRPSDAVMGLMDRSIGSWFFQQKGSKLVKKKGTQTG
jgi:hypothetical protein